MTDIQQNTPEVQKLIHHTLLFGVWISGTLMALGFAAVRLLPIRSEFGYTLIMAGLLLLIMTPALRLVMLCYGYWRTGEKRFSLIAALVVIIMMSGLIISK